MTDISRVELLKQKELLSRAIHGTSLIEERLSKLMEEFKAIAKRISLHMNELTEIDLNAMKSLGAAISDDGTQLDHVVKSISQDISIQIEKIKVFGIDIPDIPETLYRPDKPLDIQLISLPSSVTHSISQFENLFYAQIDYVRQIIVLQRLGREIKKTRRQLMVLENDVIPSIKATIAQINLILDEREREEQIRLRKFKQLSANTR